MRSHYSRTEFPNQNQWIYLLLTSSAPTHLRVLVPRWRVDVKLNSERIQHIKQWIWAKVTVTASSLQIWNRSTWSASHLQLLPLWYSDVSGFYFISGLRACFFTYSTLHTVQRRCSFREEGVEVWGWVADGDHYTGLDGQCVLLSWSETPVFGQKDCGLWTRWRSASEWVCNIRSCTSQHFQCFKYSSLCFNDYDCLSLFVLVCSLQQLFL